MTTKASNMESAISALAESLAVAEGSLHLFWGSASHREAYMATAAAVVRPLEIRGWRLARLLCIPEVPEVSP